MKFPRKDHPTKHTPQKKKKTWSKCMVKHLARPDLIESRKEFVVVRGNSGFGISFLVENCFLQAYEIQNRPQEGQPTPAC